MKRLTQLLMMAAVVFAATACMDDETSAVDMSGSATIKGIVFVDSDNTDGDRERAGEAVVRATYNARELSVVSDGDNRWVTLQTTTDANGNFSFEVPATPNGVDFTIDVDDFESQLTYNVVGGDTTVAAVYEPTGTVNVADVRIGETRIEEVMLGVKYVYNN